VATYWSRVTQERLVGGVATTPHLPHACSPDARAAAQISRSGDDDGRRLSRLKRPRDAFPGDPAGLLGVGRIEVPQVLDIGAERRKHLAEAE